MATASAEIRQLDQVDYSLGIKRLLIMAAGLGLFSIAFLSNFPLEQKIERLVKAELAKLPGCRPIFEGLKFEFLLPKVVLTDVALPASCFGDGTGDDMTMRHLTLHFLGPNFAPMGLAFMLEGELHGQPLHIRYATGIGSQAVNIQEEGMNLSKVSTAIPKFPKLEGRMDVNLKAIIKGQQLQDLQFLAQSKSLVVPTQGLGDFRLPRIALGNFALKAQTEGKKIKVEQLTLGQSESPIRANFKGTVTPAAGNLAFSPVDLTGEAAFSPEFLQSFSILNLMLGSFTQKDGFYQIRLGGTLGQMAPMPL